jgi:hypothetical protein
MLQKSSTSYESSAVLDEKSLDYKKQPHTSTLLDTKSMFMAHMNQQETVSGNQGMFDFS